MRPRNKTYKRKSYKRKNKRSKRIKKSRRSFIKKTKESRKKKFRNKKSRMVGGSGEAKIKIPNEIAEKKRLIEGVRNIIAEKKRLIERVRNIINFYEEDLEVKISELRKLISHLIEQKKSSIEMLKTMGEGTDLLEAEIQILEGQLI